MRSSRTVESPPDHLKDLTISLHEAGHVVASLFLDALFDLVTVVPEGPIGGYVLKTRIKAVPGTSDSEAEAYRKHAVISLAGGIAHEMGTDVSADWGRRDDLRTVDECSRLVGNVRQDDLEQQATDILRRHWPLVRGIAAALRERKTLCYDECLVLAARIEGGDR